MQQRVSYITEHCRAVSEHSPRVTFHLLATPNPSNALNPECNLSGRLNDGCCGVQTSKQRVLANEIISLVHLNWYVAQPQPCEADWSTKAEFPLLSLFPRPQPVPEAQTAAAS
jgi:hypothetical protein